VSCQDNQNHSTSMPRTHLEVLRIHMHLVTMQLTQLSKGALEVVHVLNSITKGGQHLLAMCLDLGVTHYGRSRGQVAKVVKESLGPGVNNQEPILFHIHFAPQVTDKTYTRLLHEAEWSNKGSTI
uniref:Uncharacterized protein n=1 Tax=Felis catus TaxID=9685 RepID=A0ABI7YSF0_FELCA